MEYLRKAPMLMIVSLMLGVTQTYSSKIPFGTVFKRDTCFHGVIGFPQNVSSEICLHNKLSVHRSWIPSYREKTRLIFLEKWLSYKYQLQTFLLIDLTLDNPFEKCFKHSDIGWTSLSNCSQFNLPLVCQYPCSESKKWSMSVSTFQDHASSVNVESENIEIQNSRKLKRSKGTAFPDDPRIFLSERRNPIELLASNSEQSDEDYSHASNSENDFYDYGSAMVEDNSELDMEISEVNEDPALTIYNAEHDLNAMTIGRNIDLKHVVDIVDNVLTLDREALFRQRSSVGNILSSFDTAVSLTAVDSDTVVTTEGSRVSVLISDTSGLESVSGLVLSSSGVMNNVLPNGYLAEFKDDITVDQLANRSDIDGAVLLPKVLRTKTRSSFTVFAEDNLFQSSENSSHTVNSRIISVSLKSENYADKIPDNEYVYIIFKPKTEVQKKRVCVFWNFTSGGHWSDSGCDLLETSSNGLDICRCNHATHFAEIITDADLSSTESVVLDIISIVGCSLSLLGLLGIAITAIFLRQWRAELGNKFLLHLAAAIALNMITFLVLAVGVGRQNEIGCIAVGAVMHYSTLAAFCWMLVSAVLQFLRLVIVFASRGSHILLKCAIFAWGAPLTPVVTLLAIDPHLYTKEGRDFCYPQGLPFYTAVLGPVALIVVNNLIAYIAILCNIYPCCRIGKDKRFIRNDIHDKKYIMRCLWLSVLLFFLFGLTWICGFFSRYKVFAYIFCTSATLQGFVLFIFFIVGEKKVRKQWSETTSSWAFSGSVQRRTKSSYTPASSGTRSTGPRTTIASDGRVETSFDF